MKLRTGIAALFSTAIAITGSSAFGQASIAEIGQKPIYVDAANGADSNPGTVGSPVHSLQTALNQASVNSRIGLGTKVLVQPGVYRETLTLPPSTGASATITVQAAVAGGAVISGSDVVSGWSHSSGAVYSHTYSGPQGGCPSLLKLPPGTSSIAFKRDMIFVDGGLLTQVLSRSAMRAGTFYVDGGRHQAYIWLSNSANPSGHLIEVAQRPHTFTAVGRNNLVVRGMTFQHAASCINDDSAIITSSSNVLVDSVKAQWNNFGGLHLSSTNNSTVQNSVGIHNGGVGFSGFRNRNVLFQFDESDYNNWRGAMGNFYDYGMGGFKFLGTHTGTFRKLFAYHNQAQGLWFDTDNKNITIDGASIVGNYYQNVQIELNQGPITMKNSLVCSGSNGMIVLETHNLTVSNTMFYNNGGGKNEAQIFLAGKPGGRSVTDWETHQSYNLFTEHAVFQNNVVEDGNASQYVFATYLSGNDWNHFASTFHSNNNQWYDGSKAAAFDLPASTHVSLPGWRGKTGQDTASRWGASAAVKAACGAQPHAAALSLVATPQSSYTMKSGTATVNLQVKSAGTQPVKLETDALPQGVTASLSAPDASTGNATLTLKASSQAARQQVPVTVYAQSGTELHAVTVNVDVDPGN